jgi:hypothetical protein
MSEFSRDYTEPTDLNGEKKGVTRWKYGEPADTDTAQGAHRGLWQFLYKNTPNTFRSQNEKCCHRFFFLALSWLQ